MGPRRARGTSPAERTCTNYPTHRPRTAWAAYFRTAFFADAAGFLALLAAFFAVVVVFFVVAALAGAFLTRFVAGDAFAAAVFFAAGFAFAAGLAAIVFFAAGFALVVVAFFAAVVFFAAGFALLAVFVVAVFLAAGRAFAAFLAAGFALVVVAAVFFAAVVAGFLATTFTAAGLPFASRRTLPLMPLGSEKIPLASPRAIAWFRCVVKDARGMRPVSGCFARMYFLIVGRPRPRRASRPYAMIAS